MTSASHSDLQPAPSPAAPRPLWHRVLAIAAVLLGLFQIGRLFWLINRYSVDVPYWDQWGFYRALIAPHSVWEIFAWQHGPHRQGIGFFLTWLVNSLTGWDQRAQCFAIGAVMIAAALAALALKRRLFGSLQWHDVILVLLIASVQHWEIYAGTPNVSHGAMPLLLIVLSALAWTLRPLYLRYAAVLVLGFLATYTGFGLFVGVVNPLLFAVDFWQAALGPGRTRGRGRREALLAAGALLLAGVSLGSFYTHYHLAPAAANFKFPDPNWHLYPVFMSLQFAGLLGVRGVGAGTIVLGFAVLAGLLGLLAVTTVRLLGRANSSPSSGVVFFLLAFALAFSANAAIGRLCVGLETAASSRYVPLLVPAAIAVYFALLARPAGWGRGVLIVLMVMVTMLATMRFSERGAARAIFDGKNRWVAAYRQTHQVAAANAMADFKVYPWDNALLGRELAYLQNHRYSFFRHAAVVAPASAPASQPAGGGGGGGAGAD